VRLAISILAVIFTLQLAPLFAQRGFERYALILEDPPLARQVQSRQELREAAWDRRSRLEAAQSSLRSRLSERNIPVTGAVQTLLNAVFVAVPEDRVAELKTLPGVRRVAHMPRIKRHLDRAVELVNAPNAWNTLGGIQNAGAGVKIAIIDTGIDQNHAGFQDSSLSIPAGYPKCRPLECSWTNNKVIVARSYVDQLAAGFGFDPAATSRPDDLTPRDRVGHGTAAAMVAAGARNTGPLATITGVAPKAWLGSYKIFGSPGLLDYTYGDIVIQALEDALADGMDIASLSLGSTALYGPTDTGATCGETGSNPCDVRAAAVQNAVSLGMTVVVSAGNDGDIGNFFPTLSTIATPGTAPAAITVGATTNAHVIFQEVRVTGGDVPSSLQNIPALFGDGPLPSGTVTAPLRDVSRLGNNGRACTALAAGSLSGAIGLVERGDCTFADKVNHAQAAGAAAVVIYRTDSDVPFKPGGLSGTGIPAAMIGRQDGFAVKDFLGTHLERAVAMDPLLKSFDARADDVADFSSRGPSIGLAAIKPEVVAVGTDMYSATQTYDWNSGIYDPSGYTVVSGTSFSGPMAAGTAALVKQVKGQSATPAVIKSAIVNTASNTITDFDGQLARVTAVGAGKLNAGNAVRSTISADPAVLSFGVITTGMLPVSLTLKLTNAGNSLVNLNLADQPRDTNTSAGIVLSSSNLSLGAGQTTSLTVRLEGTQPPPGNYEGAIAITGGAVNLRIPYLYLVGDGVAQNIYPLLGGSFEGIVSSNISGTLLAIRLLDQFGVPVRSAPVVFRAVSGGGFIDQADAQTDVYGIAAAIPVLGPQLGEQRFTAEAGGLIAEFNGNARSRPAIYTNGIVNAASNLLGDGLAPGSYAAIYGEALSDATVTYRPPNLALALANVSVSFDAPGISVPGRLHFVSPGQVNLQIPWEVQGLNSVKVKVSIGDFSSAVYTLKLAQFSPALFEYPLGSGMPAALDEAYNVITTANPVERGKAAQLFLNGLGPVDRPQVSGEPAPLTPLIYTTAAPTVTIGGLPATVEFSGLAPTWVGLYQVNVRVPTGLATGNHPLVLTIGGVTAKTVTLPVK
jgi:uncharacterized protein (TIGR03437 family)